MKIGLVDQDGKMPNIALMKISKHHKNNGDSIKWYEPLFDYPDRVYISKIFNFTEDYQYEPDCDVVKGGSGYDIKKKLPNKIEKEDPDYTIYPDCNYSIQMFSRGCIRNCPFCVVREKEGKIKPIEPMKLNPKGEWIEVFDNNFFANPKWEEAINKLIEWNQPVNFHGIDVRILNKKQANYLNKLKHKKQIHIAWDNPKNDLTDKLKMVTKLIKPYKLMCYVLIGYWSSKDEDLWRVKTLDKLGIDPFVMPYDKSDQYQKNFSRWVNHKAIFNTVKWKDYKKR